MHESLNATARQVLGTDMNVALRMNDGANRHRDKWIVDGTGMYRTLKLCSTLLHSWH